MRAYELQHATGTELFVDPGSGAPLLMLKGATFDECWTLPTGAEELVARSALIDEPTTRETVIKEIAEALQTAKLSKQARSTVEKLLEDMPR